MFILHPGNSAAIDSHGLRGQLHLAAITTSVNPTGAGYYHQTLFAIFNRETRSSLSEPDATSQ